MNLSSSAQKNRTVGEVVNLISVDVERIQDSLFFIQSAWSTPIILVVAMVFLWLEVGASCLAGLIVIFITVPINGFYIGRTVGYIQVYNDKLPFMK